MNELMQMVIDKLGVKVNEVFKIDFISFIGRCSYHFDEYYDLIDERGNNRNASLISLLHGEYKIIKIPFKPEYGQKYYFVDENSVVDWRDWRNDYMDYYLFNTDNCFETYEEITKEIIKRKVSEMKSKYESEVAEWSIVKNQ